MKSNSTLTIVGIATLLGIALPFTARAAVPIINLGNPSYSARALPAGSTLNTNTGIISGRPTETLVVGSPLADEPKRNVLFIMSDDLRDAVGCYGHALAKTPQLDRLATRAVRFDRAYAQYPVCNPSRVSLLTGLRCEQTGIVDNQKFFRELMPEVVTLPQLLRQQGWTAHCFGKIFHVGNTGETERTEWFDTGKSWDQAKDFTATSIGKQGRVQKLGGGKLPWCSVGQMEGSDDDQPDGQIAAAAIQSMEQLTAAGKPWMVAAGFHRPHDPFLSPAKYFALYPAASLPLYQNPPDTTSAPPLAIPKGWDKVFAEFSDADRRNFLQAYLAGVSFMDAQVGRLLDTLDRLKAWDHTVVIFLGDHGYHLGERSWWNKNTLFDRSCRAPLMVAAPGMKGGQVCRSPVEFLDLYPTLVELCGLKAPHTLAGKSLRPVLVDATVAHKDAAFTLVTRGPKVFGRSVRTTRWRFTLWSDGEMELYDHDTDPEETQNLSSLPPHQATVAQLKQLLTTLPRWPSEK